MFLIYIDSSELHVSYCFLFYPTLYFKYLASLLCLSGLWLLIAVLLYELCITFRVCFLPEERPLAWL